MGVFSSTRLIPKKGRDRTTTALIDRECPGVVRTMDRVVGETLLAHKVSAWEEPVSQDNARICAFFAFQWPSGPQKRLSAPEPSFPGTEKPNHGPRHSAVARLALLAGDEEF